MAGRASSMNDTLECMSELTLAVVCVAAAGLVVVIHCTLRAMSERGPVII